MNDLATPKCGSKFRTFLIFISPVLNQITNYAGPIPKQTDFRQYCLKRTSLRKRFLTFGVETEVKWSDKNQCSKRDRCVKGVCTPRGLSGMYPAILNISRTGCVALMVLGSQSEETLLCIRDTVTLPWG